MSTALPIGIAGCGRITERAYVPALRRLEQVRLVAVADLRAERAKLIAARVEGCRVYGSAEDLVTRSGVAAVVVATPTATHPAVAAFTVRAGIPVLIEKPLASSLAQAVELEGQLAAAERGRIMMAFNRRFWEPVTRLKQIVDRPAGGGRCSARLVMTGQVDSWQPIVERTDALLDLGSHQLDLLRYLFGREIVAIRARWTGPRTIHLQAILEDGIAAECVASHSGPAREAITVYRDRSVYHVRRGSERITPEDGARRRLLDRWELVVRKLSGRRSSLKRSFERQLGQFADGARAGMMRGPSFADGLAAARAVDAAHRSAARGGEEVVIDR